jgi:hypothetical protein
MSNFEIIDSSSAEIVASSAVTRESQVLKGARFGWAAENWLSDELRTEVDAEAVLIKAIAFEVLAEGLQGWDITSNHLSLTTMPEVSGIVTGLLLGYKRAPWAAVGILHVLSEYSATLEFKEDLSELAFLAQAMGAASSDMLREYDAENGSDSDCSDCSYYSEKDWELWVREEWQSLVEDKDWEMFATEEWQSLVEDQDWELWATEWW